MFLLENTIVTRFMSQEIEELPVWKLIDFLPDIKLPTDQTILDNWMKYFRERKIPFFLVNHKGGLKLWKKREVVL